jgi:hypothetical protein
MPPGPALSLPYDILMPSRLNPYRKLTQPGARKPTSKEAMMLDVAFVALGIVVLALMGAYALALRQL